MINFIAFLGQLYPCKVCRLNLQQVRSTRAPAVLTTLANLSLLWSLAVLLRRR